MESWEAFFREKSARRSARQNYRSYALWLGASISLVLVIAGILALIQALI